MVCLTSLQFMFWTHPSQFGLPASLLNFTESSKMAEKQEVKIVNTVSILSS